MTKIFVTGPQRSGSTFVSHCLADSHRIPHIDETEFDVYFLDWFYEIADKTGDSWVVHAPGLLPDVFAVQRKYPDVTFAVVRRDIQEIQKSQERIKWSNKMERRRFFMLDTDVRPIAEVKYVYWDRWKEHLHSWVEYEYGDFENHPAWVPEERRKHFQPKQWQETQDDS
jgi:hypothetical protein